MRFTKMHGAGNDYVYVDLFQEELPAAPEKLAPIIADRHFGVGGDGLVLICPSDIADARMRMFNLDGSESEMCGNAIRCVAKYVAERKTPRPDRLRVATGAGVLALDCYYDAAKEKVERVRVDMGKPILNPSDVPTTLRGEGEGRPVLDLPIKELGLDFSSALGADSDALRAFESSPLCCVSMGNPHCVVFVDAVTDALVTSCGPIIERSLVNFPKRVNVEFIERVSNSELKMRVWERGSGETLACGTGACASTVAAILTGRADKRVRVHLRGGDLEIEWDESSGDVFMTGPAVEVFTGVLDEGILAQLERSNE